MKKQVQPKKISDGIVRAHPRAGTRGVDSYKRGRPGKLKAERTAPTLTLRDDKTGRIFGRKRK